MRRLSKIFQDNKGLTLIEVVIASIIFFGAITPIYYIVDTCLAYYQAAGEIAQLVAVGKAVMEQVIAENAYFIVNKKGLVSEDFPDINYDLAVTNYESVYLKEINVKVYSLNKPANFVSLTTVRSLR